MPRFLHSSDFHLREDRPERLDAFGQVIALAGERSCDHVIVAGDLFDRGHDAPDLRTSIRNLIEGFSGKVILIPGNHDIDCYSQGADYGKNAIVLRSSPFDECSLDGCRIIGVPFQNQVTLGDCISGLTPVPDETILIAHGSLYKGWLETFYEGEEEKSDYLPILEADLRGSFSFVALGHFHSGFAPYEEENTLWCYPGTPISLTSKEIGKRHVAVVEFEPGTGVSGWEKIPLDTEYWKRSSILVKPGKEDEALVKLSGILEEQADSMATMLIVLSGITRIGEREFRDRLEKRIQRAAPGFAAIDHDFRVIDWSQLLEDPMIEKFADLIAESNEDEKVIEEAMRIGLSAFSKVKAK
jgi:DNA repair exonuclease SbcCD nuclease subunit